jgi:hypothetical protein
MSLRQLKYIAEDCGAASMKFSYGSNVEAAALCYDPNFFFMERQKQSE